MTPGQETRDFAAKKAGFSSKDQFERASKVVDQGVSDLVEAMDEGAVSISAAAAVAELPPEEQESTVRQGPKAVRQRAAELRKRANRKQEAENTPEPAVTGMTLVNGKLVPDPPEIAELRRKGRIAPGSIPVEEWVGDVPLTPEDFQPLKDAADDLPDDLWLEEFPLYRQLEGEQKKRFIRDALIFRKSIPHIRALQRISEGERHRTWKRRGPYERRWGSLLTTNPPGYWELCPPTTEGGCAGRGELPAIGESPKCRGGGYVLR